MSFSASWTAFVVITGVARTLNVREMLFVYFYGFLLGRGVENLLHLCLNLASANTPRALRPSSKKTFINFTSRRRNLPLNRFSPRQHHIKQMKYITIQSWATPNALNYSNAGKKAQTCTNISIGGANEREKWLKPRTSSFEFRDINFICCLLLIYF